LNKNIGIQNLLKLQVAKSHVYGGIKNITIKRRVNDSVM